MYKKLIPTSYFVESQPLGYLLNKSYVGDGWIDYDQLFIGTIIGSHEPMFVQVYAYDMFSYFRITFKIDIYAIYKSLSK